MIITGSDIHVQQLVDYCLDQAAQPNPAAAAAAHSAGVKAGGVAGQHSSSPRRPAVDQQFKWQRIAEWVSHDSADAASDPILHDAVIASIADDVRSIDSMLAVLEVGRSAGHKVLSSPAKHGKMQPSLSAGQATAAAADMYSTQQPMAGQQPAATIPPTAPTVAMPSADTSNKPQQHPLDQQQMQHVPTYRASQQTVDGPSGHQHQDAGILQQAMHPLPSSQLQPHSSSQQPLQSRQQLPAGHAQQQQQQQQPVSSALAVGKVHVGTSDAEHALQQERVLRLQAEQKLTVEQQRVAELLSSQASAKAGEDAAKSHLELVKKVWHCCTSCTSNASLFPDAECDCVVFAMLCHADVIAFSSR